MYMLKLLNSSLVTTSRIVFTRSSVKKSDIKTLLSAMPKKSTRRSFCTESNVSVNLVYLEVIGSGAIGVPASVALFTNYGPYLINCGEGAIKLSSEYKIKLHKSPNVFITYPSWKNIAGLFGVALGMEQVRGEEFYIHSDSDIECFFSAMYKLVHLRHLRVRVQNYSHHQEFSDGIISAKYVYLYPSSDVQRSLSESSLQSTSESLNTENEFHPAIPVFKKNEREKSPQRSPKKDEERALSVEKKRTCMNYAISYIFKTQGSQGSLNFEKCLEQGVPPGPLLGKLKNGIDVTLDDGRVIRSADVKQPDLPGVVVIAVECPSEDYLDSLLEEPSYCEFQSEETPANSVIHFSSAKVIKNPKYQEWINRFPKSTIHLFLNEENKRTGSVAIHRQQYKLNLLHPELFPLLDNSGIPDYPRSEASCIENGHVRTNEDFVSNTPLVYKDKIFFKCESNSFINAETLCVVNLKPKQIFDYSRCIVLKKETFYKEMFENDEIKQKIEEGQEELREIEQKIKSDSRVYPKIVFLGTGSSKPSKVRNGSAILIYINSSKSILLDCGEYTFGQLVNFYGLQKAREVLRTLEAIYISHMHLDHHMGLITLLKERKLAFDELKEISTMQSNASSSSSSSAAAAVENVENFKPLFILGPVQMLKWLELYSETLEDISNLYDLIPNTHLLANLKRVHPKVNICKNNLNLSNLTTVYVTHCPNSFGVSLVHNDGWKITYSGDTRPSEALINLGMNSDILIHEATLDDIYANEARVKLHSTTSQAIEVGKKMNAKYILLTHFSQRYCYLPNINPSFSNLNIGIAYDFMEVPFNKLPLLPALIKPLQYAFSKYYELNKTITESVLLRKERIKRHAGMNLKDLGDLIGTPAKVSRKN